MPRPFSPGRTLLRSLEDSATPLAAFNAARQVVFANAALGEWLGMDSAQLLGRRCDYRAGGDDPVGAAAAAICPPPEAFAGQAEHGFVSRLAAGERAFERRPARFVHLAGAAEGESLLV